MPRHKTSDLSGTAPAAKNYKNGVVVEESDASEESANDTISSFHAASDGVYKFQSKSSLFIRFITVSSAILLIVALVSIANVNGYIMSAPQEVSGPTFWAWYASNIFGPHVMLYIMSVFIGFYILPESKLSYVWWLTKQSAPALVLTFLIIEVTTILWASLIFISSPERDFFFVGPSGYTTMQNMMWVLAMVSYILPVWFGYRIAWKSYRAVGAQTEKMRYEEYLRKLEIQNSGRWWDRGPERIWLKITGRDGNKPRMGFIWVAVLGPLIIGFCRSFAVVVGGDYLVSLLTFTVLPVSIAALATIQKKRDFSLKKNRMPKLVTVRGPGVDTPYNPASSGARHFSR